MQNLPGVRRQDGKVQLRGNDKVTVLIDIGSLIGVLGGWVLYNQQLTLASAQQYAKQKWLRNYRRTLPKKKEDY